MQRVGVHVRQVLCSGHTGQSIAQRGEHGAVAARRALAGAIAAQGRRGQPGGLRQILAPAVQPGDVLVQLLTKAHGAPPAVKSCV